MHRAYPLGCDRTRWEVDMHFEPVRTARQAFAQQFQLCLSRDTFVEDGTTIDYVQESLKAGVLRFLHFQDNEAFPRHSYEVVREVVQRNEAVKSGNRL